MLKLDPLPGKDLERGKQEPVGKNLPGNRLTQFNGQSNPEDTFTVFATYCSHLVQRQLLTRRSST